MTYFQFEYSFTPFARLGIRAEFLHIDTIATEG